MIDQWWSGTSEKRWVTNSCLPVTESRHNHRQEAINFLPAVLVCSSGWAHRPDPVLHPRLLHDSAQEGLKGGGRLTKQTEMNRSLYVA